LKTAGLKNKKSTKKRYSKNIAIKNYIMQYKGMRKGKT